MFAEVTGVPGWVALIVLGALSISMVLAFVRLIIGPSLADRVVALDLVAYQAVAIMVAYAIVTEQTHFIEPALVLALIAFLGTVAFARYIEFQTATKGRVPEGEAQ